MVQKMSAAERGRIQAKQLQFAKSALDSLIESCEKMRKEFPRDPFLAEKSKSWAAELTRIASDVEHSRDALAKAVAAAERLTPKQEELL